MFGLFFINSTKVGLLKSIIIKLFNLLSSYDHVTIPAAKLFLNPDHTDHFMTFYKSQLKDIIETESQGESTALFYEAANWFITAIDKAFAGSKAEEFIDKNWTYWT